MLDINLFDEDFRHVVTSDGLYSLCANQKPSFFRYVRDNKNWNGITLFTDRHIILNTVEQVNSTYKIAWLIEGKETNPNVYNSIDNFSNYYDLILTHNKHILDSYPEKAQLYLFAGCWLNQKSYEITKKTKLVSMVYSSKCAQTGHILRHKISQCSHPKQIDFFGTGSGHSFDIKEMKNILAPYMFNVVVENTQDHYWFTEKLLNVLAVGSIPIYWGAKGVSEFFDMEGIITFDTMEELDDILLNITPELYYSKMEHIKNNLEYMKQYDVPEDWIYKNILEKRELL